MLAPIQSCTVQLVSVSIIVAPEKHKSTYLAPVALKIAFTTKRMSPCKEHELTCSGMEVDGVKFRAVSGEGDGQQSS
ncbi:uncharacterized protein THITE_2111172 [Thermothielavioides terrestris NRRL 8126]|uniref:Uncharacterized protein n=1 Tax=Thermothielavioides terrestris (strain ATCC 38088 / NRRL 8126) TaxID=578455 RepID=G2R0U4_THETT|nr:uncharacterized protein THITE_2111172 [Thermothielavioides terrestris NRRL 8126]AEO64836.1 hypothetical protein THITE_2111172 [Thermothielavioides terrestris NRRL 8126]